MTRARLGARQRASAHQIAAVAGLWVDLDVEPGKIPTREDAFVLRCAHIEPTITIDSGHGLHCWYLLADGPWYFTTKEHQLEAASLARRFVALHQQTAARHGWRVDPVGDLARLLRLPGTLNAKTPDQPRPVVWLNHSIGSGVGPRHALDDLRTLLAGVQDEAQAIPGLAPAHVNLTGDTSAFGGKLDALIANSPEFAAVWHHEREFGSLSEADMSLCSMAAGAMTDPELAQLIAAHRARHGTTNDTAKGARRDYLTRTIAKARARDDRAQRIQALHDLGRKAA